MHRLVFILFGVSAVILFSPGAVAQDEVVVPDEIIVDGDRLRGEVIEQEADGVRFKTFYGEGELFIPFARMERFYLKGIEQEIPDTGEPDGPAPPMLVGVAHESLPSDLGKNSPESIDAQLQQMDDLQEGWIEQLERRMRTGYFHQANDWMDRKLRLRFGTAYSALGMIATSSPYGDSGASAGDFDIFGRWRGWGMRSGNTGTVAFNIRHRHRFTGTPPSQLNSAIGSPWNVTSGFSDTGLELTQAYLDQYFLNRNVVFRAGQMFQDLHFDTHSYKSQKLFFLNAAFSDNPAVAFPGPGVGFATMIRPVEGWYILSGVGDSQERKLDSTVEALFSDTLFSGLEVGWAPQRGVMKDHSFALFGWTSPADSSSQRPDGNGLTFTYEWKPEKWDFTTFVRGAWSASDATLARWLTTGGMVFSNPFGRSADYFGFAIGWGDPSERPFIPPGSSNPINVSGDAQGVVEVFHRFQITRMLQVSPDVQLLVDPSFNLDRDVVVVFGLRARIAF